MLFPDSRSADVRLLTNPEPLTTEEIRGLMLHVGVLSDASQNRLQVEQSLMNLLALKRQEELATQQLDSFTKFNASTAKANKWMLGFTATVTFMTLAVAVMTYLMLRRMH